MEITLEERQVHPLQRNTSENIARTKLLNNFGKEGDGILFQHVIKSQVAST